MKHVRLFEELKSTTPKFKTGNYVHIDMEPDFSYEDCLAKITKVDVNGFLIEPNDNNPKDDNYYLNHFNPYPYSILFYNKGWNIEEKLIDRLLTDDEIKLYEYLKVNHKNINKFNL